jgi:hypothetical protein
MLFAMPDQDEEESDSTIVRSGKEAFRFAEMSQFVKQLQERPLQKLVDDLEGLMALPEAKYALVSLALSRRMRESPDARSALRARLEALKAAGDAQTRRRCEALLA